MKYLFAVSLLTFCAFAQAPTTPPPAAAAAQPPAVFTPDTVVAKIGAKPMTVADVRKMVAVLPGDLQTAFMQNPKNAIQSIYLLQYLTAEAEKAQLDTKSPYKEQIAMQRMQLLAQARSTTYTEQLQVSEADQRKRYEIDKPKFDQAKIRMIYIAFADPQTPAPVPEKGQEVKTLSEAEAKAKSEGIVKKARGGADFAELAKANSDDKATAVKGGDYGKITKGEKIPDDIKDRVFALKVGEVSEPIKQNAGFFIIKVDEFSSQPFKDVQPQILVAMKQERFQEWMQGLEKQFEVTIENPAFFPKKAAASGLSVTTTPIN